MELTELELKEIFAHAEEGYPDEVCGIVLGKPGDPKANAVHRCANLANQHHLQDPIRYPRDARTAYIMDPKGLLRIQAEADAKGLDLIVIYHSHTDHEAYFSQTDRELALFDGEPLWPGARYLIVSVNGGKVSYFKVFRWNTIIKDFSEELSPVPQA
ncbi:MAG: Mov34/MPN/PAD-1 family protein [Candidatus Methylomirabilis sp.]